MTFLNMSLGASGRIVPGAGPANAKIAIVGEAPGAHEDQQLKPFVGPAGSVLEQCLHASGLIKSEVYLTNVVKVRPPKNDISPYYNDKSGKFTEAGQEWVDYLHNELAERKPNLIVACGGCALAALTGIPRVLKYRGYFFDSSVGKVLPTIHPSAALRGMYLYRHLIAADLKKAKEHSATRELRRPDRQLIYNFTTPTEVLEWLDYYEHQPLVCFDIEVMNYELSCIGFSSDPSVAISVPLDSRWSLEDELLIWTGLQRVLGTQSIKVVQNGIFDIAFLLTRCGIEVRGPIQDTMIAHSIMYPELRKGLDFLGSIYCGTQPYWKDAIKWNNIKEDS
jgi:uracil-DNA glycosylase family 4